MTLTIFTPAYNRTATLPRLYESLLGQSCLDFEWLIIDDGSTDHTPAQAARFTGEGKFPVRYLRKENGGKHTACNLALKEARGNWFLCVDSDDLLVPGAVEYLMAAMDGLPKNTGIAAYKTDLSGKLLSDPFPAGLTTEKLHRLSLVHGCCGEFTLAFPTAFARQFPFPVFPGERFISESVVYDRMDEAGQMYLLPRTITLCEYQPDGLSHNISALMKANPNGFCLYFLQRIDRMPTTPGRLACAGKYWCFRRISGNPDLIYQGPHRITAAIARPLGPLFRLYYKLFRKI